MRSYDSYEAIIPYMRVVAEACLCNIGALIIRIGFRAPYTIIIIRNPQNSIIGNH